MSLLQQVKQLAQQYKSEVIAFRHHLHAHPELSFEEYETAAFVENQLKAMGLQPQGGIAGTGVSVLIKGKNPDKKVIALRADMDALPIVEANEVPYKSKKEGVMHACGHDVHTASLLGVARILSQLTHEFEGSVKLIFQPGEEKIPGGASLLIKEGILKNPEPKAIIGQHVMPQIPVGKVGFREGMYMASADEIYVTVKGKGGHGAMPEMNIDPVLISAHILVALQQIVSRNASPKVPSVLSFGKVIAQGATNIIPNEVKMEGTFRTMNEEWRSKAHGLMKKMAEGIAESMGGSCEFTIMRGYPFLTNHPELTAKARTIAQEYLGEENVVELDLWMAAEDFSYYSQEMDACFYRLGVRNEEKGIVSSVHTPTFNIDEGALEIGAGLMAYQALKHLE
ncbi:M20 family metallopeptidase [Cytophagales bacterium LB-30]|uniref:M20 family metallopeptidase n=1 Tax=Shiella aurantiaca TaxID=3058365 RepID=A0ABT8F676_9BACT|nr:M20 family metallopeptidase [Shiella aurantiaca]MDN4165731.1 M20 family metallopeptidase [Shiella aurantiaca]